MARQYKMARLGVFNVLLFAVLLGFFTTEFNLFSTQVLADDAFDGQWKEFYHEYKEEYGHERDERRETWKQQRSESRDKRKQRQDGQENGRYNQKTNDEHDDDDDDEKFSIGSLIHGPRDIIQGAQAGIISLTLGIGTGIACLIIPPYSLSSFGLKGIIPGFILGALSAAVTTFIGALVGLVNVLVGLMKTPGAIYSSWFEGKVWDPSHHEWRHYSLEEEIEELNVESTRTIVQDSTFYNLLGVETTSTSKEIKRAYYKKAKDVHPDKNPDDEDAAAQFVQLHHAYQTLMDPKTREAYDSWGRHSSAGNDNDSLAGFNVDIFFEILFGSQVVEPYVGQLAVASFVSRFIDLALVMKASESSSVDPADLAKLFSDSEIKTRQRPVQVAQHLRERIQAFVDGNMSESDFHDSCDEEANSIALTGFGNKFLLHIGEALVQESSIFLQRTWYGLPLMIFSSTARKTQKIQRGIAGLQMLKNLVVSLRNNQYEDERKAPKINVMGEEFEIFLPQILDLAWAFNARDISKIIELACQKLLTDSSTNSLEQIRRAKALKILGKSFLRRAKDDKESSDGDSCEDPELEKEVILARLHRAFQTAKN